MGLDISQIKNSKLRDRLTELKRQERPARPLVVAAPDESQTVQTQHVSLPGLEHVNTHSSTEMFSGVNGTRAKTVTVYVEPCPKPRMTRCDVWKKRPAVMRYRAYCDTVRAKFGTIPPKAYGLDIKAYIQMPDSWSAKKKAQMDGKPHQQKPDFDNLLKAVSDALFEDDSAIWTGSAEKRWCKKSDERVEITVKFETESVL